MPGLISLHLSRAESFKTLEKLPRLSPLMMQFLARLSRPQCDVGELASLVERDTVLTAQVLQLANSAVFQRVEIIHGVKHAVARIGVGTMRRFVLGCSVLNLFSRFRAAASFSVKRFNLHSVAAGTLVEILSEELPAEAGEDAFIAGLLHDIGKLLIATNLPAQFENILAVAAVRRIPMIECEREVLDTDHAELSAMVISRWELPDAIQTAARFHHDPEAAGAIEKVPYGRVGLSQVVHQADAFVNFLGMSVLPPRFIFEEPPPLGIEGFSLSRERVLDRFEKEWETMSDLFK